MHCVYNLPSHLKAAFFYRRSYGCVNVLHIGAEAYKSIHRVLFYIGNRASPSAMNGTHNPRRPVLKQKRYAVRGKDHKGHIRFLCDITVTFYQLSPVRIFTVCPARIRPRCYMDTVPVYLLSAYKFPLIYSGRLKESVPVFRNPYPFISPVHSEIKGRKHPVAYASDSRGKSVGRGYGRRFYHIHRRA